MSASIETQNISFSYESGTSAVFQDISISVQPGDVFCLLGPNGIGKSTLLKCLGGILRIREGRILLNGRNLFNYKLPELAQKLRHFLIDWLLKHVAEDDTRMAGSIDRFTMAGAV